MSGLGLGANPHGKSFRLTMIGGWIPVPLPTQVNGNALAGGIAILHIRAAGNDCWIAGSEVVSVSSSSSSSSASSSSPTPKQGYRIVANDSEIFYCGDQLYMYGTNGDEVTGFYEYQ